MTIFPELERQLVAAAAATSRSPRAVWRSRLRTRISLPLLAVGALAAGGTAIAATQLWEPIFGEGEHRPEIAAGPAPAEQAGALAVLRRPATAGDRGADVQETIRRVDGRLYDGIYPDTLRKLATIDGQAVVLFATSRVADTGDERPSRYTINAPLCVAYPLGASFIADGCWKPHEVRANQANGQALGPEGAHLYGLVPDDVATVTLTARDGRTVTRDVVNNFYDFPNPAGEDLLTGAKITWQDRDGRTVQPATR